MSIIDLQTLLRDLQPQLDAETYVFCMTQAPLENFVSLNPLATFLEEEGLTLVITKQQADQYNWEYTNTFKRITLSVYSSLEAVGLTAAVSTILAQHNISTNMIAAFYHDHLFVPSDKSKQAIHVLTQLSAQSQQQSLF